LEQRKSRPPAMLRVVPIVMSAWTSPVRMRFLLIAPTVTVPVEAVPKFDAVVRFRLVS